jgi:PAS domain S-box-containing protein
MVEELKNQDPTEELRALRARVVGLENQVDRLSVGGGSGAASYANRTALERAADGFFEQPLAMLFIADLVEGRYLRVNQLVCEVLGYSMRELLETSFLDRIHPDDRLRTMREMEHLLAGKRTSNFRNRHRDVDGIYRVLEWTAVADANRELCYAMAVEITE